MRMRMNRGREVWGGVGTYCDCHCGRLSGVLWERDVVEGMKLVLLPELCRADT